MPGNGLPIYSSDKIISEKIDVCFTAMSYENEQKVREKNQGFIIDGGQLVPISPNAEQNIYNFFSWLNLAQFAQIIVQKFILIILSSVIWIIPQFPTIQICLNVLAARQFQILMWLKQSCPYLGGKNTPTVIKPNRLCMLMDIQNL